LKLLPEWSEFSQGNEIYISSNEKVGKVVAEAHNTQLGQDDALHLMRAAVILRKCCLQRQEPFSGSFRSDSLTSPVSGQLRRFLNILLEGPSFLRAEDNEEQPELQGRARVASVIGQQIMYNICRGSECMAQIHHDLATLLAELLSRYLAAGAQKHLWDPV